MELAYQVHLNLKIYCSQSSDRPYVNEIQSVSFLFDTKGMLFVIENTSWSHFNLIWQPEVGII